MIHFAHYSKPSCLIYKPNLYMGLPNQAHNVRYLHVLVPLNLQLILGPSLA